jgi:hypothetical protein
MHMGVSTGFEPEPVIHRGFKYPARQPITGRYGDPAPMWEEVGSADMRGDLHYEFDEVRVFKHSFHGGLLIAHDSGCSCPSPFGDTVVEHGTFLNSLVEFDAFVDEHVGYRTRYRSGGSIDRDAPEEWYPSTVDQVARLRKVLEEAIPAQPTCVEE